VIKKFISSLKNGGYLIINYIYAPGGENLEISAEKRKEVLSILSSKLIPLVPIKGSITGIYKKRSDDMKEE
ncbi:MAG: hypothetical protein ACFFDN_37730, partial [Candidatus Hodarchaeota archaeon]